MAYFAIHFPHQSTPILWVKNKWFCINPLPGSFVTFCSHQATSLATYDRRNPGITSRGFGSFFSLFTWLYMSQVGCLGFFSTHCTTRFTKTSLFFLEMCHLSPCRWKEPQEGVEHVGNKHDGKTIVLLPEYGQKGWLTWRDVYCCSPS